MPFTFQETSLPGVVLVEPRLFRDGRGFFSESYKLSDFAASGIELPFVQDNFSYSIQGVLRGLHYQKPPFAQAKLVMVAQGSVFDVAVDIRRGAPTYGQWVGFELSAESGRMLFVPAGFAHGFCVLSETACVTYKVTAEFSPENDRGILWNDPALKIDWPVTAPILSPKDAALPLLKDADNVFAIDG
jgi:dTDP-4-dehydrorhamnose 3,5-epimerase